MEWAGTFGMRAAFGVSERVVKASIISEDLQHFLYNPTCDLQHAMHTKVSSKNKVPETTFPGPVPRTTRYTSLQLQLQLILPDQYLTLLLCLIFPKVQIVCLPPRQAPQLAR
jgi:hypothetical protein